MVVGQFLEWIESAPAGRRAEAARGLARAYLLAPPHSAARAPMEAALTVLLDGGRADVKRALAEVFADSAEAPRHLVLALASDQVSVAAPLLARSPLFVDAELVDLMATTPLPAQIAIASRPRLSTAVAAAIAEIGEAGVCLALLGNAGAAIDRTAYARIAERHGDEAVVRDSLLARPDLPPEVHQRLVKRLADALGGLVVAKAWVTEARAAVVTREATDRATVSIAADAPAAALPGLVEHLRASGQLTTLLILRAVCAGNLDFFEAALATLAAVPLERVVSLVTNHRLGALRTLYANAGLPPMVFDAFAAALDVWAEVAAEGEDAHRHRTPGEVAEAILTRYAGVAGDTSEIAATLRRFAADQAREAAHQLAEALAA